MRKIKRSTLNPEAKYRLNVMLSEGLGKKLRKESEDTHYSQSHIIGMALEEHFSPEREDQRMAIVNERLEFLGGSISTISDMLPNALKAALEDDFAKIVRSNMHVKHLEDKITSLRSRLAQSEKLRGEGQEIITELRKRLQKSEATIKAMEEQYHKIRGDLFAANARNEKSRDGLAGIEKKTLGAMVRSLLSEKKK